jgi:hypothetical protein
MMVVSMSLRSELAPHAQMFGFRLHAHFYSQT